MNFKQMIEIEGKVTDDVLYQYAKMWYDYDGYSDLKIALDRGYLDLALKMLYNSGAIDSSMCFEWAKPIERVIEKLVKKYSTRAENKDRKECFDNNVKVWINAVTREHWFLDINDIGIPSNDELISYGYTPSEEFYKETK
jgi:hypothetical protein